MPRLSTDLRRIAPARSSSWAFISVGPACTTSTVRPRFCSPRAASRPSSPPPMHDGLRAGGRLGDHGCGVVEGAEAVDAVGKGLVVGPQPGHRREERSASGGQDQLVVPHAGAVVGVHDARERVDPHHPDPGPEVDVVVGVPVQRVQVDLRRIVAPGKHIRQQDAVVVSVRLVAEHRHVVGFTAAAGEDLLDRADARHAVADDDEAAHQISTRPRSTTTVPAQPLGAATNNSSTVSPSRSSTTRSATCVAPFAAIGK